MKDDPIDAPIVAQDYIGGVTVVDIGDIRVARGMSRRPHSYCKHRNLTYDSKERRIYCHDCERTVDSFDAFVGMVEVYDNALKKIDRKDKSLRETEKFQLRRIAARKIDEAWRSKKFAPGCPHCKKELLPEHFKDGVNLIYKDHEAQKAH